MKERAYAKINLALNVTGKRADGYHELESVMLPVDFYDVVEINIADEDSYTCNWKYLRYDEHNSIYKMIDILKKKYDIRDHHEIILSKSIPVQAGLGGGTADAAAALRIFEKMYDLHLSAEEIREICVSVGADVFFNYHNIPAVVKGIGDVLEPIEVRDDYYVLLVKPRSGISTAMAYQNLNLEDCDHPDIDELRQALKQGRDIDGLLGNSLQKVAQDLNEDIRVLIDRMKDIGSPNVLMSGSGSTVFSISRDKREILRYYDLIYDNKYYVRFGKILKK